MPEINIINAMNLRLQQRMNESLTARFILPITLIVICVITLLVLFTKHEVNKREVAVTSEGLNNTLAVLKESLEFSMAEGMSEFDSLFKNISSIDGLSDFRLVPAEILEIDNALKPDEWENTVFSTGENKQGFVTHGIEISEERIAAARNYCQAHGVEADIRQGDMLNIGQKFGQIKKPTKI